MSLNLSSKRATPAPVASSPVNGVPDRPIGAPTVPEPDIQWIKRTLPGPRRGFLRLKAIIGPEGPIPVARSTWWAGVRSGRYPAPVKLGPRITAWRVEDIEKLIERAGQTGPRTPSMRRRGLGHG